MRLPACALAIALLLPLGAFPSLAQDALTYTGSSALAISVLFEGALKAFEAKTGFRFDRLDLSTGGVKGIAEVAAGKATVAGASRRLKQEEKEGGLEDFLIGKDPIFLWVNGHNPVASLTRDQLRAVLSGKALNWKEVGGPDLPILLVLAPPGTRTAARETVASVLLGKEPWREDFRAIDAPREQVQEVSIEKGGLCLSGGGAEALLEPSIRSQVRILSLEGVAPSLENIREGRYPLARDLCLVTKGKPEGKVKAFVDFMLSPEGQGFVGKSFLPVTSAAPPPGSPGPGPSP